MNTRFTPTKEIDRKGEAMNFEDAIKKLEKIVEELEVGDISLDKSLEKFQEGIELSSFCLKKLEDAEKKITILLEENNGTIKSQSFNWEENNG